MDIKLKPCPLCGGQAVTNRYAEECHADGSFSVFPIVYCLECGLTLAGDEHFQYKTISKEELIALEERWNRRV